MLTVGSCAGVTTRLGSAVDLASAFGEGPGSTLLLDHLVSAAVSSMAVGCGITDLQHPVAESGATIFLALVEKCRNVDRRDQHFEFVGKARSIVVELGWFVWNRSHLAYIIETMCAIATRYQTVSDEIDPGRSRGKVYGVF
jgi:hypothetical protein